MAILTVYEWMLIFGDKLVEAIQEGGISGPSADKLLTEAQQMDSSGKLKDKARRLLRDKLAAKGMKHVIGDE